MSGRTSFVSGEGSSDLVTPFRARSTHLAFSFTRRPAPEAGDFRAVSEAPPLSLPLAPGVAPSWACAVGSLGYAVSVTPGAPCPAGGAACITFQGRCGGHTSGRLTRTTPAGVVGRRGRGAAHVSLALPPARPATRGVFDGRVAGTADRAGGRGAVFSAAGAVQGLMPRLHPRSPSPLSTKIPWSRNRWA